MRVCWGGVFSNWAFEAEAEVIAGELLFQGSEFSRQAEQKRDGLSTPLHMRKAWKTPRTKAVTRYVTHGERRRAALILPLARPGCPSPDLVIRTSVAFDETYGRLLQRDCAKVTILALMHRAARIAQANGVAQLGHVEFPCDTKLTMRAEATRTHHELIVLVSPL